MYIYTIKFYLCKKLQLRNGKKFFKKLILMIITIIMFYVEEKILVLMDYIDSVRK